MVPPRPRTLLPPTTLIGQVDPYANSAVPELEEEAVVEKTAAEKAAYNDFDLNLTPSQHTHFARFRKRRRRSTRVTCARYNLIKQNKKYKNLV